VSEPRYDWKRFWYPKGGTCKLDFAGYLDDPESSYAHITNPEVVSFEAISGTPCLVLLGEPGSGKSISMEQAFEEAKRQGKPALKSGLRGFDSGSELSNEIFGNSIFQDWLNSTYQLDLFLDSLDEGLLSLSVLSDTLSRKLKNFPYERLNLRLTCRTADWRSTLEENLRQIWGKDNVGIYELAPLRRVDVEEAVGKNHLDSEAFLREIQAREAVPLAIQPITLNFLLRIYRENKQFPSTRKELYYKGCRNFCDENNPYRREAGQKGKLDLDKRMMIAGRIAAVIIFANRVAIWTGSGEPPSKNYIAIQELCGIETLDEREFSVTETATEEVLKITSLFSSYGDGHNSFCFTHQTYAEFLAAWYLAQHRMTLAQRMSLLQHPADPDRKLVPQLHEVAAWLASLVSDAFREIVETDPDVILHSDVATADQESCVVLVESLLRLHNEEKLLYESRSWLYQRLKDKNLVSQIQPYITDISKSEDARYVAIDIARACQLEVLQHDLANVAIDPSQPYWVRVNAAYTVSEIGDIETKKILKPLALGEAGDDPNNELKGYGLQATYPSHMTAKEVFDVLTQPDGNSFGGTYQNFVARDFAEHLQVADLPLALAWVEAQQPRRELRYPFGELSDAIMFLAWEHLESPGVLEAFARIAFTRWSNYRQITSDRKEPSFESLLLNDAGKRRLLLEVLVGMIPPSSEKEPIWLLGYRTQIILQEDFPWMIEQLQLSQSEHRQKIWAQLVQRIFRNPECSPDKVNIILSASRSNETLHEVFRSWIEPIGLGSPEAQKIRDSYLEEQEWLKRENSQLGPSLADRITACLDEFESGNLAAWWSLNMEMTLMPSSKYYDDVCRQPDITALNGWQTAELSTRSRIVDAAEKFVVSWQRESQGLLGLCNSDVAGYKALRLLLHERPRSILNLSVETWKTWAPVLITTYWISSDSRYVEPHLELTKLAYEHAPTEVLSTLIAQIDRENEERGNISITQSIKNFWDERLAKALLKKLEDPALKPESVGQLLEVLLAHKVFAAKFLAESLIPSPPPSVGEQRSKAIFAARALIFDAEDAGWSIIWSAIQQDPEFGKEVLESVSYFARETGSVEWRLSENQVLELYRWLARQYPKVEKPKRQKDSNEFSVEDYEVKPEESAIRWQGAILQHLKERGTPQSCEALQQIAHEFPDMAEKLKRILLEAQLITRRRTWSAPTPQEVFRVTSDRNVRLVNGADQLLDVVIESLDRLNQKLQGETPSAFLLWDQIVSRPKDEQALSDYVKLHLEEDLKQQGVIAKREVEIRRRHGDKGVAASGERVDLQVDAFVRLPNGEIQDCVSVIIEVKGCWNKDLDTAMQAQLVERYLKDNRCQHGLYLIGWFNCKQWDNKDSRNPPKLNIEEAKQKFEAQAAELSKQGIKVKAVVLNTALR
jgi:predicted NACHT family NTPase